MENGVEEICCILDVGRDEGDKGFEVVFNVFGEVVGGAVTARNDWAILSLSSLGKRQNRGVHWVSGVEETCRWCSQCDRCLSCDRGIV